MILTMGAACGVYPASLFVLADLGNHGLWLAFCLFMVARTAGRR
ncbi:MAG TPA: hypothetical protein VK403_03850 [Allosphingosinicella sp.]|nr:hypothetical protein [Allosphingosinicella sp.]